MEENRGTSQSNFTSAMTHSQTSETSIPQSFILPPQHRPLLHPDQQSTAALPVINLSSLDNPLLRSSLIAEVRKAFEQHKIFQVINHGIPTSCMDDALAAASEFFDLPPETKMRVASSDIHAPVRYGTSVNHVKDKVFFWRDFIKQYSHPVSAWIDMWPSNPPSYKKSMANYAEAVQILHKKLMGLVFESLGLKPDYLEEDIEQGSQVLAINCYPVCPEPNLALGLPPHSDYGTLTILLQNQRGLEIMDRDGEWKSVPMIKGALVIQLGDQMEVLSNGRYRSLLHRATLNSEKKRLSIASIHSLSSDKKVAPAPELVDEQHPLSIARLDEFIEDFYFLRWTELCCSGSRPGMSARKGKGGILVMRSGFSR